MLILSLIWHLFISQTAAALIFGQNPHTVLYRPHPHIVKCLLVLILRLTSLLRPIPSNMELASSSVADDSHLLLT